MMAIQVFGQGAVQSAYPAYIALDITLNSLTLVWPDAYVDVPYTDPITGIHYQVLAATIDVTKDASNDNDITLPNAMQVSVGQTFIITNVGANHFVLKKSNNVGIVDIEMGISYWITLIDNSTPVGVWRIITLGAGVSEATALELAGNGLVALLDKLNTNVPVISTDVIPVIDATYRATMIVWTGGVATIALPAIGSVPAGFYFSFSNLAESQVTIQPSSALTKISGKTSLAVTVQQSLTIISDGTDWQTLGFGQNQFSVNSVLSLNVSASVNVTLNAVQASSVIQEYSGALTANIVISFPAEVGYWYIHNATTGTHTLSVKLVASAATYIIPQGSKQIFYSDGTDLFIAPTSLSLVDGTTATPAISFSSSPNTGIYSSVPGTVDISIAGSNSAHFTTLITSSVMSLKSSAGVQLVIASDDAAAGVVYNNTDVLDISTTGAVTLSVGPLTLSTGQVLVPNGTIPSPAYSFSSRPNTGMYNSAADQINFSIGGVLTGSFQTGATEGGVVCSSPSGRLLQVSSGNTNGNIAYNSVTAITISATGAVTLPAGPLILSTSQILVPNGTQATPAYSFSSTTNTGIFYSPIFNDIEFSIAGSLVGTFQKSGTIGAVTAISSTGVSFQFQSNNTAGSINYNSITAINISSTGVVTLPTAPLPIASGGTNAITAAAALNNLMPAAAAGSIVYYNGTNWVALPLGTSGQVLTVNAGATAPEWA